jgi:hypothetical protein
MVILWTFGYIFYGHFVILWPFRYFMALCLFYGSLFSLWPFGYLVAIWLFYGHLVILGPFRYFMAIWYIPSRFGMLRHEKSGHPGTCICFVPTKPAQ